MEKQKKSSLGLMIIILICTILIALIPTEAEANIYTDTIRLHIVAESDSEEDQALKLFIRDKIIEKYSTVLTGESIDTAYQRIEEKLDEIGKDVNYWMHDMGFSNKCQVSLGLEWYDTRVYENFTFPKGYYKSLIIKLGKAEGRNWWCVMYPPLCLDIATEQASGSYTHEEEALITQSGYNVKFKILEAISSFLR